MKKHKLISALCAVALLVSALPAASAVEAEPLSAIAGKTMELHVTHVRADGEITEHIVDVDIPENATQKVEMELVNSAATSAIGSPSRSSTDYGIDQLAALGNYTIRNSFRNVYTVYLERDYHEVRFYFNNVNSCSSPAPDKVSLRLTGGNLDGIEDTKPLTADIITNKLSGTIIISEGDSYNGVGVTFANGDYFDVNCRVNQGWATFAGIIIMGYYER